ncbi:Protein PHOSPHATE STARVATION RESPONSE 3 [Porphyridium purpureum]|uniref:Protein PHOSPHATE STARVATION RESPONSE 3 n=1 Tax=Porphyridium purpureum TaxID=35688 RepID=A0A5J4YI24_PORPP|nr:Protein PHOSPHATE STARVATION RESPONSE 3 [Porphyridium purpureum]|eukprot:POR8652..scf297_16
MANVSHVTEASAEHGELCSTRETRHKYGERGAVRAPPGTRADGVRFWGSVVAMKRAGACDGEAGRVETGVSTELAETDEEPLDAQDTVSNASRRKRRRRAGARVGQGAHEDAGAGHVREGARSDGDAVKGVVIGAPNEWMWLEVDQHVSALLEPSHTRADATAAATRVGRTGASDAPAAVAETENAAPAGCCPGRVGSDEFEAALAQFEWSSAQTQDVLTSAMADSFFARLPEQPGGVTEANAALSSRTTKHVSESEEHVTVPGVGSFAKMPRARLELLGGDEEHQLSSSSQGQIARGISGSGSFDGQIETSSADVKPRLSWKGALHDRFVHVLNMLAPEHRKPKLVLQIMNVEGLHVEQVKSRMQKHRMRLVKPPRQRDGIAIAARNQRPENSTAAESLAQGECDASRDWRTELTKLSDEDSLRSITHYNSLKLAQQRAEQDARRAELLKLGYQTRDLIQKSVKLQLKFQTHCKTRHAGLVAAHRAGVADKKEVEQATFIHKVFGESVKSIEEQTKICEELGKLVQGLEAQASSA